MKRKLALMALAAAMVVSNAAPYTVMTAHAAENDEIGDILDDVFGGNKPDNSGGTGSGHIENEAGGGLIEDNGGSDDSSSDNSGSNDNGGSSDNSGSNSGNSGSDNSGSSDNGGDDIGDILDDIFGGNKPDNSGGTGSGHIDNEAGGGLIEDDNSDSSNTGNSGSNTGSSNTGSNSGSTGSSTTVVTTDPATGETTTVTAPPAASSIAVDVTDPAILAVMPEAMVVISHTSGIPFVHALDATKTSYNVWSDGYLVDAFYITDAAGTPVVMQAVDIVPSADGKVYVNVTLDPAVVGATVQAAEEQRVAFAKHYGIDGVMINGVLIDTFVALAE